MPDYSVADFDFELPPALIAQHPAPSRSGSRLLDGSGAVPGAHTVVPGRIPTA